MSMLMMMLLQSAYACPGAFASATCDAGGADVCTSTSDVFTCDLTTNGDSTGGSITVVTDFSPTDDFSAWGVDAGGNTFCCEGSLSFPTIQLFVYSSSHDDEVDLQFGAYDLELPAGHPIAPNAGLPGTPPSFAWFVFGDGGNDDILGSRTAISIAVETLFGGAGDDTIDGDDGADRIIGGPDHDVIDGGAGDDVINGNAGDDEIEGGLGADAISGGADHDDISGGRGSDILCGDSGEDIVDGGPHADSVWNIDAVDVTDGGPGMIDYCDSTASTILGCEGGLAARPACPLP